jgi:hypothetical protein
MICGVLAVDEIQRVFLSPTKDRLSIRKLTIRGLFYSALPETREMPTD